MNQDQTLAIRYDAFSSGGRLCLSDIPGHVLENLNPKFAIRPYQKEALLRWFDYCDTQRADGKPLELLFNMATGSGKTLLMAALIIDLYQRGYRNFIFFVDKTNIIEKTKDNFLNSGSSKYLFNRSIVIDGNRVSINMVDNFEATIPNDINIHFTTTGGLHIKLNNPAENSITYEGLAQNKLVLLSDEAHHVNAETKSGHTKSEQESIDSWERTVKTIVGGHSENVLLEFTATIDMSHSGIFAKYKNKILYQYDLKAFRQDGYSKDVLIYEVDAEPINRALQAMIISQYRKKVALENKILLKPVVLFKSKTIIESGVFYEEFKTTLERLKGGHLARFKPIADGVLKKAFGYFEKYDISLDGLASELKNDFHEERTLLVDSENINPETQLLLNRLEDNSNEIRAIFAVDMLNEGWDVLNLFDIVRLYDSRDARYDKPGKTTIREAQLIGRGARYYPFGDEDERYTRKYDNDTNSDVRVLEELHYHSKDNPNYIKEISQALKESGIMPYEVQQLEMNLKPDFKATKLWRDGFVWVNRKVKNDNVDISSLADKDIQALYSVKIPSGHSRETNPFAPIEVGREGIGHTSKIIKLSTIEPHIVRKALNIDPFFTFRNLKQNFGSLESVSEFIESNDYLGGVSVELTADTESMDSLTVGDKIYMLGKLLAQIKELVIHKEVRWVGTKVFEPLLINQVVKERVQLKIATSESKDREYGRSTYASTKYRVDLHTSDWYVHSDHFGTSEEKSLVKTIDSLMDELKSKWDDIYLIRNEKFIKIYAFDDGKAFEPDFILSANDKKTGDMSWQVFIEPKGAQFLGASGTFDDGKEGWKQQLLLQIKDNFQTDTLFEDGNYSVVGLPFYNEEHTKGRFIQELVGL